MPAPKPAPKPVAPPVARPVPVPQRAPTPARAPVARIFQQPTAAELAAVVRCSTDSGMNPRDILGNRLMVDLIRARGADGFTMRDLRDASGFTSVPPSSWLDKLGARNGFSCSPFMSNGGMRYAIDEGVRAAA